MWEAQGTRDTPPSHPAPPSTSLRPNRRPGTCAGDGTWEALLKRRGHATPVHTRSTELAGHVTAPMHVIPPQSTPSKIVMPIPIGALERAGNTMCICAYVLHRVCVCV